MKITDKDKARLKEIAGGGRRCTCDLPFTFMFCAEHGRGIFGCPMCGITEHPVTCDGVDPKLFFRRTEIGGVVAVEVTVFCPSCGKREQVLGRYVLIEMCGNWCKRSIDAVEGEPPAVN